MKDSTPCAYGLFNDSFPPIIDGVTLTVLNYASGMEQRGMRPVMVTPWNPTRYDTSYEVMRYFSLPILNRKPYRYGYPKLDPVIRYRLRQCPFKIVHSHSPFSAGRLARYTAQKLNVPLVGTFHSKYRTDLERGFEHAPWMVHIIMNRILDFFNACDEVWIPQAEVEETVREYGFKGDLKVVDNGNDMADKADGINKRDCKREVGIDPDVPMLLFVGQHIWEKGIGLIAEALSKLPDDFDFRMVYIGEGYAKDELKHHVDRLGISDKVRILGELDNREQLMHYYRGADLFLFPSMYDNAPLVVREAAACSTPSLLPIGSTASAVITDGENGFLTNCTSDDYAIAIEGLINNADAISRAGQGARNTLVRGWDDVITEVLERYQSLIQRKSV